MAFRLDRERARSALADSALDRPRPARAIWPFTHTGPSPTSSTNSLPRSPFAAMMRSRARLRRYRRFPHPPRRAHGPRPGDMVAPSGRFVYALNRGHDSLAI